VAYYLGRDAPYAERLRLEVPQGGTEDLDGSTRCGAVLQRLAGRRKDAVTGGEKAADRRTPGRPTACRLESQPRQEMPTRQRGCGPRSAACLGVMEKGAQLVTRRRWSIPVGLMTAAVALTLAVMVISGVRPAQGSPPPASPVLSRSAVTFHDAMRELWEDHITWTRNVIISFEVNDPDSSVTLPDLGAALDRLFQNQVDIGNAIKPYYGNQRGEQLTALLHDHIAIAGEILQAVKTGNTAAYQDANARWYANAHDIAVFLSETLDPSLASLAEMDAMMKDHLDATTEEVVARLTGDWIGDVAAYDKVHNQALQMADMLSDGIIANFPAKFRP
jgi:hypothetical protein